MVFRGNLVANYRIPLGNEDIDSVDKIKYLGVTVDGFRNFWPHVQIVVRKSDILCSRLRAATSADWGINQATSRAIYIGQSFCPGLNMRYGTRTRRAE